MASSSAEPIDFQRAKNFWQARAANTERPTGDESPPKRTTSESANDEASTVRSTPYSSGAPPVTPVECDPPPSGGAAPVAPMTPAFELDPPSPPHPPADAAPLPSPPPPPPQPPTVAAKIAMSNMFKTFQETKFFGSGSSDTSRKSEKDGDATTSPSLPTIPVQLPDMTVWKEKVKTYSEISSTKMTTSFEKLSTQLKTSLNNVSLPGTDGVEKNAGLQAARSNIHLPNRHNPKSPTHAQTDEPSEGTPRNPYGELVVAEILAAKDLAVGDFFQGESDPYVSVKFRTWERKTAVAKSTKNPVYNERFVFWVASSPETNEQCLTITVYNRNLVMTDEHLGEVHLSLRIPLDEAFDDWYPLVKEDGQQQGTIRIGVRRMVLTSSSLLFAGQSLAANERSLNDEDLAVHGATIPNLWYGFAEAAEPIESKVNQTDVLATKLNDLSRRFMGIELASTEVTPDGKRRDIF